MLGSAALGGFLDLLAYRLFRRLVDQLLGSAADLREPGREKVKEHGDQRTGDRDETVSLEAGAAAAEYAQSKTFAGAVPTSVRAVECGRGMQRDDEPEISGKGNPIHAEWIPNKYRGLHDCASILEPVRVSHLGCGRVMQTWTGS